MRIPRAPHNWAVTPWQAIATDAPRPGAGSNEKKSSRGNQESGIGRVLLIILVVAIWVAITFLPSIAVAASEGLPATGQKGWTPPVGSGERQAIADALRREVKILHGLDARFVITHLKVKDDWARPQSPGGENSYEDIAALFHKVNGVWQVVEIPCIEPDNPGCLDGPEYIKGLQRRFPEAPGEIFPGF